jgi:hypothetical protein
MLVTTTANAAVDFGGMSGDQAVEAVSSSGKEKI